jgi:hypothetical protein
MGDRETVFASQGECQSLSMDDDFADCLHQQLRTRLKYKEEYPSIVALSLTCRIPLVGSVHAVLN